MPSAVALQFTRFGNFGEVQITASAIAANAAAAAAAAAAVGPAADPVSGKNSRPALTKG